MGPTAWGGGGVGHYPAALMMRAARRLAPTPATRRPVEVETRLPVTSGTAKPIQLTAQVSTESHP
jgi:hypothetical protein